MSLPELAQRALDGGPVLLADDDRAAFRRGDEVWTTETLVRALAGAAGKVPAIVRLDREAAERLGLTLPRTPEDGPGVVPALLLEQARAAVSPSGRVREIALADRLRRSST